ncbi:MarR family transcriptional regulator [Tistrella mobilis]
MTDEARTTDDGTATDDATIGRPGRMERFGMHLVLIARLYRRLLDQALHGHGLSEARALPLRYLARLGDGTRQGRLAEVMNLEGPTLVRVIDQLVADGHVERVEDSDDRRARLVRLTPTGRELAERLGGDLTTLREGIFRGVADADLAVTLKVMAQVEANLRDAAPGRMRAP